MSILFYEMISHSCERMETIEKLFEETVCHSYYNISKSVLKASDVVPWCSTLNTAICRPQTQGISKVLAKKWLY